MTDISEEYRKMLKELHEQGALQPGEFTIRMYINAQTKPMTREQGKGDLNRKCAAGILERLPNKKFVDDSWQVVYRFRETANKD